ncbi:hypothetical protein EYR40_002485 [Pleurotus pulmonarius]|nr:hypothetical protein EYR40_002485 [Pleurotus pulmonarius]
MRTEAFDYVIVGAGLAGLVVAVRLTENPDISVCVIEAGGDNTQDTDVKVPGLLVNNLAKPEKDWMFMTVPQDKIGGRPVYSPRGKGVGGSSSINFMQLGRSSKIEYDGLERDLGSQGWNWESFLHYLRKSETFTYTPEEAKKVGVVVDPNVHGTSGPLGKTLPRYVNPLAAPWVDAMIACGVPKNWDSSTGNNVGVWTNTSAIGPDASRSSSASCYYNPVKEGRKNLTIILNAHATRIVLDNSRQVRATGVEYIKDDTTHVADAKREVIISAGAYQTPQLLELSGDPTVLQAHDIPVRVKSLGVGKNLQEHYNCTYVTELKPGIPSFDILSDPGRMAQELELYEQKQSGMLSSVTSAFAFLPGKFLTPKYSEYLKRIQAQTLDHLPEMTPGIRKTFELQKQWAAEDTVSWIEMAQVDRFLPTTVTTPEPGKTYCSMSLILLHPLTRGTVHIGSKDPKQPPVIDPRWLENDIDADLIAEGIAMARKMIATDPLRGFIAKEIAPGPEVQGEGVKDFVRATIGSTFHPLGTAAMLPEEDNGVVGPDLKVYGTENLRIVDASILPIQMSSHIQTTVYALAEKAADIIKKSIV